MSCLSLMRRDSVIRECVLLSCNGWQPLFLSYGFFLKKIFFNFYFLSFVNLEFQSFLFLFFKRKKHNWIDSIAVKQLGVLE